MQHCVFKKIFCVIITSLLCCNLQAVQLNKLSRFFTLKLVLMQRKIKSLYKLKQFKKIKNFDKWQSKFQSKCKYFKKNKKLNKVLLASPALLGLLRTASVGTVATVMEFFASGDCTVIHEIAKGGCGGIIAYVINEQQKRMKEERSKEEDAYWANRNKALRSDLYHEGTLPWVVNSPDDPGCEEIATLVYCEDLKCSVYKFLTVEESHKHSMQELKRAREAGAIPETSVYNHLTQDGCIRIPVVYQLPIIKELKDGGINGAMSAIVTNHPINNPGAQVITIPSGGPNDEVLGGGLITTKKKKGDRGAVKEDGRVTVPEEDKKADYPGKPNAEVGYYPPKKWDGQKVKVESGKFKGTKGFPDKGGRIWVPTGHGANAHGGPHWDIQYPSGDEYDNVKTPEGWKYGEYSTKLEDIKQKKLFKKEFSQDTGIRLESSQKKEVQVIKLNDTVTNNWNSYTDNDHDYPNYDSTKEEDTSMSEVVDNSKNDISFDEETNNNSSTSSNTFFLGDDRTVFDKNDFSSKDIGVKLGNSKGFKW